MDFINKLIGKEKSKDAKPKPKPKVVNKQFGGYNQEELKNQSSELKSTVLSDEIQEVLNSSNVTNKKDAKANNSNSSIEEHIATIFSEGFFEDALATLRDYINENKGNVDKKYWLMLLDILQILGDKDKFEAVSEKYSISFGISPPIWPTSNNDDDKKGSISGDNILIIDSILNADSIPKFKSFVRAAKEQNFCRINLSPCKFEQSEYIGVLNFYNMLLELRKNRVKSILMGDNILFNLCKSIVEKRNSTLSPELVNHEKEFWLIYLELLQWKGNYDIFEEYSLNFAMEFELSPPDWDPPGIMSNDNSIVEEIIEEEKLPFDNILTYSNIDDFLNYIKNNLENTNILEIDLSKVVRIDFPSVGSISSFLQEILASNSNKKIIFHQPNELIIILFEMLGVNEFVTINRKNR